MSEAATGIITIPKEDYTITVMNKIADPMAFVEKMGIIYAKAGVAGAKNEAQGQCLALACLCKGMNPFDFSSQYHLIDGKPQLQAHAILARIRMAGGKVKWISSGDDLVSAIADFTIDNETTRIAYTMSDAVQSVGKFKEGSAWQKTPAAMLRAALSRKAAKMLCPEVLTGDVDPEEFAGDEQPAEPKRARPTKEEAAKRAEELKAMETMAVVADFATEPVVHSAADAVPFDVAPQELPAQEVIPPSEHTATLLEIELVLGELKMTKPQLEKALKARNPAFTTLDDLPLEAAKQLLTNVRASRDKSAAAKLPPKN